jgi:hypothetical protein
VCYVEDGTNKKIYLDGVYEASEVEPDNFPSGTDCTAGTNGITGVDAYRGELDEFVLYDRALSVIEIGELYNSGTGYNPYYTAPIDTAIDTLQTRDDAYCSKIKGLNLQEQNIYEWYKANPKSTDHEIAEMSGVKLASVNGRRNSLVEKGMLKPTDKKYCEDTECWRTTYMITDGTEARTRSKALCLSVVTRRSLSPRS